MLTETQYNTIQEMKESPVTEIMKATGLSKPTVYRWLNREYREPQKRRKSFRRGLRPSVKGLITEGLNNKFIANVMNCEEWVVAYIREECE